MVGSGRPSNKDFEEAGSGGSSSGGEAEVAIPIQEVMELAKRQVMPSVREINIWSFSEK